MRAQIIVVMIVAAAVVADASAAQRTFVRSDGVDSNPCSIASPCRSFGAAIAQTDPNGEIVVLDSAGYGIVTVNKGVTITAPPGIYAGLSVPSGSDGIDVAASGEKVVLRGLAINGLSGAAIGIVVSAAAELHIEYCVVSNMGGDGIHITSAGAVYVDHVVVRSNGGNGIFANGGVELFVDDSRIASNVGTGIRIQEGHTSLNRVAVENNGSAGVSMQPGSGANPRLSVRDSLIASNVGDGVGIFGDPGSSARGEFEHTSIVRNSVHGLVVQTFGGGGVASAHASNINASGNGGDGVGADGAAATLTVTASTMTRNAGFGMSQSNSATLRSPGNNIVDGNGGATGGTITPITPM